MNRSFITLGDMVGLAIGAPEPGTVNFRILQALLRSLIEILKVSEAPTEYDSKAIQEMRKGDARKEALDSTGIFHTPELFHTPDLIRRRSSLGRRVSKTIISQLIVVLLSLPVISQPNL